ncbi:MAG: thermonuclease family protein [Alphaproteobacteria bacterium]|nr:thermonuclease family protein [Alphaproteobacteria bacterium]
MALLTSIACLLAATLASSAAGASEVVVVGGDALIVDGMTYRLYGIDTPEPGQKCDGKLRDWTCGERAIDRLIELTDGRTVTCDHRGTDELDRVLAVCHADGVELNATMVREGFAWAYVEHSTDYVDTEVDARVAEIGIWTAPTETAWDFRSRRWDEAAQDASDGCPIKGDISDNGRIYHAPWSPWYSRTTIVESKGERWFCSEREALDAGWRAPVWVR